MAKGWSDTPPDTNGWSDAPPSADANRDPLAGYAAGSPVRDETPVDYTDPQTGQKVTVPAWSLNTPSVDAPQQSWEDKPRSWFNPMSHVDHFMEDTANLRDPSINYGIGDTRFNDGTNLEDYFNSNKDDGTLKKAGLKTVDDVVGVAGRLGIGVGDTINYLGHVIAGDYGASAKEGFTLNDIIGDALAPFGADAGLFHVPEAYLTPARQANITEMIKRGATTDEIMAAHPNLDRTTVDLNVKARNRGWNKAPTFKTETTDDHVNYNPDELSGKGPEVHPPVKPTADNVHVDPINETDETGTYHPVNIRNPETGEVVSAGRASVDPETGAPVGSVLAHPITKENHVVTPETQGVIESKLPSGDTSLTPTIQRTFVSKEISPEGGDPRFGQTHPDGQPLSVYDPDLIDDLGNSVNPEGTLPPGSTHEFTYTTSDGKVVKGGYHLNDEGEMHGLSIGNIGNPTNLGTPETINLIRSIANEHPDVHTIYAKRMSGANPNRDMVIDAQKLRDRTVPDGTTSFETKPVETEPQAPPSVSIKTVQTNGIDPKDAVNDNSTDPTYKKYDPIVSGRRFFGSNDNGTYPGLGPAYEGIDDPIKNYGTNSASFIEKHNRLSNEIDALENRIDVLDDDQGANGQHESTIERLENKLNRKYAELNEHVQSGMPFNDDEKTTAQDRRAKAIRDVWDHMSDERSAARRNTKLYKAWKAELEQKEAAEFEARQAAFKESSNEELERTLRSGGDYYNSDIDKELAEKELERRRGQEAVNPLRNSGKTATPFASNDDVDVRATESSAEDPQPSPAVDVNDNTKNVGTAVGPANPMYEHVGGTQISGGGNGGNGGNTGTGVGPEGPEGPQNGGPHEPVSDKYASSINKDKVSDDPDVRAAYDAWARSTPLDYRDNFDEINEKTKDYLSRHNDPDHPYSLFDGPVDANGNFDPRGQAPWSEAVRIQSAAETTKIARALRAGEDISDETLNSARAINGLAKDTAYGQGSAFRARQRVLFDSGNRKATAETGDFGNGISNDDVRDAVNKLNPDDTEAVQKALGLSTDKDPGIIDLFRKGYISGLVSNLANHVKIYGSQLGQYGLNFLADGLTSVAGQPFRTVPGMERLYATQMASRAIGFADGIVNAISTRAPGLFSNMESGSDSLVNLKSDLMSSSFMKRPGYNTAELLLTAPLKLLHATGDFVKDVFATSYLWDEAARVARNEGKSLSSPQEFWQRMAELRDNPTPEMLQNIDKQTKIDTFRDEMGPLGRGVSGLAQGVENGVNDALGTKIPVSTLIAPFNGIVDGVMRAGVRWGPLAPLDRYNIQGLKEGGLAGQKTVGRLAVAAGLTGLLMQYVVGEKLNGSDPINGGPPNSIKVGDNWYTIKGQSAIADNALLLANARDAVQKDKDTQSYSTKIYDIFKSMASTVLDESTVKDLTPFLAPMDKANGEYRMRNYVTGLPVQAVPYSAALREYTRSNQPYETDTIAPGATQEAINKVKAVIPGVADSLPARLDVYGRPMPSQSGPFKPVAEEADPAVQEINRLNVVANKKIVSPAGKVWTAYDQDDNPVKVKFTPEQLREYQQKSGDYIRRDFQDLINSPDYQTMTDKERIKALHNVITSQRANVRDEILDKTEGAGWSDTPPANANTAKGWSDTPPKKRVTK